MDPEDRGGKVIDDTSEFRIFLASNVYCSKL